MPNPNKRIRMFAGPNGSGKSTLYHEFSKEYKDKTGYFVNADRLERTLKDTGLIDLKEIGLSATQAELEEFKLHPASRSLFEKAMSENHKIDVYIKEDCIVDNSDGDHSYEGSFVAAFIRELLLRQSMSFSFETVMSHPSKIDEIKEAIAIGYNIYLYFVCIDEPKVNIERIADRVQKRGHDVPEDKVVARYTRTLKLLHEVLPLCYRAYLFDNSGKELDLIAESYKGQMEYVSDEIPPMWFVDYVLPYYYD